MKTKELKIQVPEGYEIDKENSTFEKIVLMKTDNYLPRSWEEFGKVKGWFVNELSNVEYYSEGHSTDFRDKNLFPKKEEAEACVALAQLCQLRDRYNDGWKPDWEDENEVKFNIFYCGNKIIESSCHLSNSLLAFKTEELRDKFLENFEDLIKTAKPLL